MALNSPLLDILSQRVMVFDGATGTQIQEADLPLSDYSLAAAVPTSPGAAPSAASHIEVVSLLGFDDPARRAELHALMGERVFSERLKAACARIGDAPLEGCSEILVITRPDLIERIHLNYFAAGSDMVETNTFGSTSIVLGEYEISELVDEVSYAAGVVAKAAKERASTPEKPRFAVGALGPGTKLVSLGHTDWDTLVQTYRESAVALLDTGCDALLLETLQDLLMVKAGVVALNEAMEQAGRAVPIFVQVTLEQTGTMLVGSDIGAALNMLECFPSVVAVGMNCATGPVEMEPHVRFLSQNSTRPISIQPNAGLPVMEKGRAVYKLGPDELARHHARFVSELGVAIVGGCCGTTPAHIQAVAEAVGGKPHGSNAHWQKVRDAFTGFDFKIRSDWQAESIALQGCSSLYQFVPYDQEPSYLIIGEKTNANGSKAFREMLAAENWEGLTELARELEGEGSHVLDVCAAYVGRDEVRDMDRLLTEYNKQITAPIMIDSTEVPVVERSLQRLGGKPIINSINFEDGEDRTRRVLELCQKYGAAVVALTIDEDGMAKTAEKKVAIAERILSFTREYGLADYDVFVDCLTFTLGSGDEEFRKSGMETIEAIRELRRRHPRLNFTLGVSNVSFGLKPAARVALNSAFLQFCREAGLTSAIVHFSKILPENRVDPKVWKVVDDLIHDRRVYAEA